LPEKGGRFSFLQSRKNTCKIPAHFEKSPRPVGDEPSEVPPPSEGIRDRKSRFAESAGKLVVIETVALRMVHQTTRKRMGDHSREHFLGVEAAPRSENAVDLSNRCPPIGYVVNDAEIEYGVVPAVLNRNGRRIAQPKTYLIALPRETTSRLSHHTWIEVETVHPGGSKNLHDDLKPNASSATDFESAGTPDGPSHCEQSFRFEVSLHRGTDGIVHHPVLGPV
jgi:hypothetical protein